MEDIEFLVDKIVRELRYDPSSVFMPRIKANCSSLDDKARTTVVRGVTEVRIVLRLLERRFPYGAINEKIAIKIMGYDPEYIGFKIAIRIINEEESGNPISIYVPPNVRYHEYPEIPWEKFYSDDFEENKEE